MGVLNNVMSFFTRQTEESIKVNKVDKIILTKIIGKTKGIKKNIYNPISFSQYIGQKRIKDILKGYITSCKKREFIFPHTLLYGKPGMGKTTLAKIIAKELGKELVEIVSSSIPKEENILQEKIKTLGGKILFIDEIHSLPRNEVETIYSMMENFSLNGNPIEPFTLIGATTELGEIIKNRRPFYDRFKLPLELEDYTIRNLITIGRNYKEETFPEDILEDKDYKEIAENSRDTPRTLIRLMESVIYFKGKVKEVFKNFGIIYRGYTKRDLKLLMYLSKNKTVGLQGIAAYLDTSSENYLYELEPYLIKTGLIIRAPNGRKISEKGLLILKQLLKRK